MKKNICKIVVFCVLSLLIGITSTIGYFVYSYGANSSNEFVIQLNAGNIIDEIRIDDVNYRLAIFESENFKLYEQNAIENDFKIEALNDTNLYYKLSGVESLYIKFENSKNTLFFVNGEDRTDLITDNTLNYKENVYEYITTLSAGKICLVGIIFIAVSAVLLLAIFKFYSYMKKNEKDTKFTILYSILYAISLFIILLFSYYVLYDVFRFFVVIPVALIIMYNIITFKCKDYEKLYLICAFTFGVLMIYIMAPCNVPDEASHYTKGYELAGVYGQEGQGLIQTPKATNEFLNMFSNIQFKDNDISARYYFREVFRVSDYNDFADYMVNYANVKKAFFVPYILCGIAVKLGSMINMSPFVIFLVARLLNLIFATVVTYFALKITPRFKKVLFIIAILPIVIQQSGAINVDTYTNAVAFLLIAYILKLIYELKEIKLKDIVKLFCFGLLLCFGKFGYFPVALMLILIPNDKFKSKKVAIAIKVTFFIFMLIVSYFFNTINNYIITDVVNDEANVYGLKYILTNPMSAIAIYFRSFLIRLDQDIFRGYFNCFGYSTITLKTIPYLVTFAIYLVVLFTKEAEDEEEKLSIKERIVYTLIFVMLIGIIYTVAFSAWTKVGGRSILGVQSRYFIPLLPLIYFVIQDLGIKVNVSEKIKKLLNGRDLSFVLISITYIIAFATIISFFA